jgi:ABC-type nitrate/sulfonate/bicarbonate transport system permease component
MGEPRDRLPDGDVDQTSSRARFTVVLFSVWVIALDTQVGVERVSTSLLEMGRVFGAGGRKLLTSIVLRAALPELLAGIRLGLSWGLKVSSSASSSSPSLAWATSSSCTPATS